MGGKIQSSIAPMQISYFPAMKKPQLKKAHVHCGRLWTQHGYFDGFQSRWLGDSHRNVGKQDLLMVWMCFRDRQLLSSPRQAALGQLRLESQLWASLYDQETRMCPWAGPLPFSFSCFFENSIWLTFLVDSNDSWSPGSILSTKKIRPNCLRGRKPWVKSWVTVHYSHGHSHTKDVKASDMREIGKMLPIWPCSRERAKVSSGVPAWITDKCVQRLATATSSQMFTDCDAPLQNPPMETNYYSSCVGLIDTMGFRVAVVVVTNSTWHQFYYLSVCLSLVHSFSTRNQVSWTQTMAAAT